MTSAARPGGRAAGARSAGLVQTLLRHELVDELRLLTFPVILGTGKRLFGEGAVPAAVRLTESRTTSAGTVMDRPRLDDLARAFAEPARRS